MHGRARGCEHRTLMNAPRLCASGALIGRAPDTVVHSAGHEVQVRTQAPS